MVETFASLGGDMVKSLAALDPGTSIYLEPVGLAPAGFGLPRSLLAPLAGGPQSFAALRVSHRLDPSGPRDGVISFPVSLAEKARGELPEPLRLQWDAQWAALTSSRPPLANADGQTLLNFQSPQLMGILNVTPDSFSDGGRYASPREAFAYGHQMIAEGARIIDIGGESTRPGAEEVAEGEEIARISDVVTALAASGGMVSIDTRKAAVMAAALDAGASIVNDVSALRFDPDAEATVAARGAPVILMHSIGTPQTMQTLAADAYHDVVLDVFDALRSAIEDACQAGVARDKIILDPGIGFGKTLRHNLAILNALPLYHALGCPLLLGVSRKRMIGALSAEEPASNRLPGSLALMVGALDQGVQLFRVHDVAASQQALKIWRGRLDAALMPPQ
ncbi:MAG: dihydropteroate synthase [Pseudomonadota bacterium]